MFVQDKLLAHNVQDTVVFPLVSILKNEEADKSAFIPILNLSESELSIPIFHLLNQGNINVRFASQEPLCSMYAHLLPSTVVELSDTVSFAVGDTVQTHTLSFVESINRVFVSNVWSHVKVFPPASFAFSVSNSLIADCTSVAEILPAGVFVICPAL